MKRMKLAAALTLALTLMATTPLTAMAHHGNGSQTHKSSCAFVDKNKDGICDNAGKKACSHSTSHTKGNHSGRNHH